MKAYDVIVLGAGGVGSAAMYHLARRGARVLGIDSARPPHSYGSSHGQTRVIRQAYFEHPDYVPLLLEAYRLWRELEAGAGKRLLHQVGLIEIGRADGVVVPGVQRAAEQHGLSIERLAGHEIEVRWPGLRVSDELVGVYEPAAGYLMVEDCVEAHLQAAAECGAELKIDLVVDCTGPRGHFWTATDQEVVVYLRDGPVAAKRLVVTAGAWAGEILGDLSLGLRVLRKSLFWFRADTSDYDLASGLPVYLFELPEGIFYGFPKLDRRGVKIAEHTGGQGLAPSSSPNRAPDAEEQTRLMKFLAAHLPGVSKEVTSHSTCLYTMSPDEQFIVDRHPRHENVVFTAGLSGHGFKFTPVLGRAMADLALDGKTDLPIEFLSLKRLP